VRAAVAAGVTTIGVPLMVSLVGTGAHALWPTLAGARPTTSPRSTRRTAPTAQESTHDHADIPRRPAPERPVPPRRPRAADRTQGRLHTVTLREGGELHTHHGVLKHEQLVGQPDGSVVTNSGGHEYLALRPLLRDFVMSMPRGAAIVYPKDAAQILASADIFPGATVVEAGVGSGALSMWLLRTIGPAGAWSPSSAATSSRRWPGPTSRPSSGTRPTAGTSSWETSSKSFPPRSPGIRGPRRSGHARPWECIDAVADALTPGGVVLCYIATATQLSRVAEYIRATGLFTEPEATETMVRGWHVEGSRCDRITGWSRTRGSSSRRAASHRARCPRTCASAR
jgi:tRNA A58 N-methylase Trm61